jgi:hypothetical protein
VFVESDVNMTSGQDPLDRLLHAVTSSEAENETKKAAVQQLRQMTLLLPVIDQLMAIVGNVNAPVPLRCGAIHVLGYHRPWRSLDMIHDDRVHHIPDKLTALAVDVQEDHAVREAVIPVVGWQYLTEKNAWETLLASSDAFLRNETLFELLRTPHREALEHLIRHLTTERDDHIRNALLWGAARHAQFYPVALIMLSRAGGAIHLHTVADACKTDLLPATRAILDADIKFFEIRETLLQHLFQAWDAAHVSCLLTLMQEDGRQFAVRKLREVDEQIADEVLRLLDQSVLQRQNEDWTEEAAKLVLHYWDRFEPLRYKMRNVLSAWRPFSSRITNMAMGKGIYW